MQKIFTQREKIILYLTIGVIGFSIIFNFMVAPIFGKLNKLDKEISVVRLKLKKSLWLLSHKDSLQAKEKKFSSGIAVPEAGKEALVNTLAELENLARQAGVRILDIRPQTPRASADLKEIIIDLRLEADTEEYLKFIYSIENSLSLLKIKKFQLFSRPNTTDLEANFSISWLSPD
jgi:hypothetical protein